MRFKKWKDKVMNKKTFFICLFFISVINIWSWNRYTNDTELSLGYYSVQNIIKYDFYPSTQEYLTFETKETDGDTYMYLWSNDEHRQIAKNDNGGEGLCSKIRATLQPGSYSIYIIAKDNIAYLTIENEVINNTRSYEASKQIDVSNTSIESTGNVKMKAGQKIRFRPGFHSKEGSYLSAKIGLATCSLYRNNTRVLYNRPFSCYKLNISNFPAETRFRIENITNNGTIYGLLLNQSGDLIGYSSNYIVAAEKPSSLILGIRYPYTLSTDSCKIWYTRDNNLEYLALCGSETRHAVGGNAFIGHFDSGSYYYQYVLASRNWLFDGYNRIDFIDGVDLIYFYGHGETNNYGWIQMEDKNWVDINDFDSSSGSGHRTNNRSGDLEYIAFMTCKTVRIESKNSWDWLRIRGWESTSTQKGFFDGVHVVVGFHSNHTSYDWGWPLSPAYYLEAKYFANYLDYHYTIWDAWKNATRRATDDYHGWWWWRDIDIGENSSIYIVPNKDDKLSDHNTTDYKYGDWGYYFGWRKYHYWYD